MGREDAALVSPTHGDDRLAVFTCIYGDGYELPKASVYAGVDYICFTDQADLAPNGWQIRLAPALLPADLARSSRETKIRPHRWLGDYAKSIYADPSVELTNDPNGLWEFLTGGRDEVVFGALEHSYRDTLLAEFAVVLESKLDAPTTVHEQLEAYTLTTPTVLDSKPVWGGLIARRHLNEICIDAMEDWYTHVMRYSRRDQLSLPGVLSRMPNSRIHVMRQDNYLSNFHRWPREGYSRPPRYYESVATTFVPAILRADTEARKRRELQSQMAEFKRDEQIMRLQLKESDSERDSALAELDKALAERDSAVAQRTAVLNSRIWKVTSWYRRLRTNGRIR